MILYYCPYKHRTSPSLSHFFIFASCCGCSMDVPFFTVGILAHLQQKNLYIFFVHIQSNWNSIFMISESIKKENSNKLFKLCVWLFFLCMQLLAENHRTAFKCFYMYENSQIYLRSWNVSPNNCEWGKPLAIIAV